MPRDKRALTSATQVVSESFPWNSKKNANVELTSEARHLPKNMNIRRLETEGDQGAVYIRGFMSEDSRKRIGIRKVGAKDPVISRILNFSVERKNKIYEKNGSSEETLTNERFVTCATQTFPQRYRLNYGVVPETEEPAEILKFRKIESKQDQKKTFIRIRDLKVDEGETNIRKTKVERVVRGTTLTSSFRKTKIVVPENELDTRKIISERNEDGLTSCRIDQVIRKVKPASLFRSHLSKGNIPEDYVKKLDIPYNKAPEIVAKRKKLSDRYLRWSRAYLFFSRAQARRQSNALRRRRRPLGVLSTRLEYRFPPTSSTVELKGVPHIESTPPSLRLAEEGLSNLSPFEIHLDTAIGALKKTSPFTKPEASQIDSIRHEIRSVNVVGKEQKRSFATSSVGSLPCFTDSF